MTHLFDSLDSPAPDKILKLMAQFRLDNRLDKVDLGVGVYRDVDGNTPIFAAVHDAERQIWSRQKTKVYTSIAGDLNFRTALLQLALAESVPLERFASVATPGGTGALRQGLELVKRAHENATIWLPDQTWANHPALINAVGLKTRNYTYYDPSTGRAHDSALLESLAELAPGDVVLLHGCCHNPTGADMPGTTWTALTDLLEQSGAIPFVDLAYQGLGVGIDKDVAGMREMFSRLPEAIISISCSKNFGLYRERAGVIAVLCADSIGLSRSQATLESLNRLTYAFPPDHGARIVTEILYDTKLRNSWELELKQIRMRIANLRLLFAEALRESTGEDRWNWIATGAGMFSLLPLSSTQIAQLRVEHGIYLIEDGRTNFAGLTPEVIPRVAEAVAAMLKKPALGLPSPSNDAPGSPEASDQSPEPASEAPEASDVAQG
ncbi:MAG: aromatic amino acid transaminase [Mangrovicoccus sp.]